MHILVLDADSMLQECRDCPCEPQSGYARLSGLPGGTYTVIVGIPRKFICQRGAEIAALSPTTLPSVLDLQTGLTPSV